MTVVLRGAAGADIDNFAFVKKILEVFINFV